MKIGHFAAGLLFLSSTLTAIAQTKTATFIPKKGTLSEEKLKRWSHLDLEKDSVPGMSVDKAHEFLRGKKGVNVIVGILDSGVDIEHDDLKNVLWTNKKEIPNNKKDDDKNGYIDDVHGWNFLGDITKENLEYERIANDKSLVSEDIYLAAKKRVDDKKAGSFQTIERMQKTTEALAKSEEIIIKKLGKPTFTKEEVAAIVSDDAEVIKSKAMMERMLSYGLPLDQLKIEIKKQLDAAIKSSSEVPQFVNYRKVLGDNPLDMNDKKYGNNAVWGPEKEGSLHGTHVAGIVAASRNNNIGGDGVANNTQIMTIRAVPDGDEYDKDIALGIRYAVDNGAKIINGSFGKDFSPQKKWVYEALQYAAKKDVLFVHAAGNDAKNIDVENNFPNDSDDKITELASTTITVGALDLTADLTADFSNYGKINVDVFAPGSKIYATTPNNKFQYLQGTSMASPNVAGVAALIRSYYPKLTAVQVKQILMNSGTKLNTQVAVGGDVKNMQSFDKLSVSGGIVNAYNAVKMADEMSKKKTIVKRKVRS